jgi:hypothetical protein
MTFRRILACADDPPAFRDVTAWCMSAAVCYALWPLLLAAVVLGVFPERVCVRVRAKE